VGSRDTASSVIRRGNLRFALIGRPSRLSIQSSHSASEDKANHPWVEKQALGDWYSTPESPIDFFIADDDVGIKRISNLSTT
jgi:hypothetical protein